MLQPDIWVNALAMGQALSEKFLSDNHGVTWPLACSKTLPDFQTDKRSFAHQILMKSRSRIRYINIINLGKL